MGKVTGQLTFASALLTSFSLIFGEEIKQNLVVSMTNICEYIHAYTLRNLTMGLVRFSYRPGCKPMSVVNRLILLSGPPGTGASNLIPHTHAER